MQQQYKKLHYNFNEAAYFVQSIQIEQTGINVFLSNIEWPVIESCNKSNKDKYVMILTIIAGNDSAIKILIAINVMHCYSKNVFMF